MNNLELSMLMSSLQTEILITETTLRSLFGRFGEVADIAIKKIQFNPVSKTSFSPFETIFLTDRKYYL